MKVMVQGSGVVTLTQQDFLASGGEGSIYTRANTAYKIYVDPAHMLPLGKITELSQIQDPNVIKPEKILYDNTGNKPVGYTMRYVPDTHPLCQLFTRAYRDRNSITHPMMLSLVQSLQKLIDHVHDAKILLVDLNEMNFLVDASYTQVYAIDVDSYQTPNYPATAIMPSVRDWSVHHNQFSEGSDWFSFACLSFQMFTGIHPYKGKHPTVNQLEDRMRQNISVFDPQVTTPKVVYPLDVIPSAYRDWLKAVLQDGKRLHPPTDPNGIILVAPIQYRNITSQDALDIQVFKQYGQAIQNYQELGLHQLAWGDTTLYVGAQQHTCQGSVFGLIPNTGTVVSARVHQGSLELYDVTHNRSVPININASDVMSYDNTIYVHSGGHILAISMLESSGSIIASSKIVSNVLPYATRLYPGVVYQNILGSSYATLFHNGGTYQIRIPELDKVRVIDAKHDHRVLMCIYHENGSYHRMVVEVAADFQSYQIRNQVHDITPTGLNFITLDNGVYACINEDEDLEISALGNPKTRVVKSTVLGADMQLVKVQGRVGFVRGNTVYTMRLK